MKRGYIITKKMKKVLLLAVVAAVSAASVFPASAKTRLDTIDDLYWNEEQNKITEAVWEEVENAARYEVYLYMGESKVAEAKTGKTFYNFRRKMTREGEYTFKVRALAKEGDRDYYSSSWSEESDPIYITAKRAEWNSGKLTTDEDSQSGPGVAVPNESSVPAGTGAGPDPGLGQRGSATGGWMQDGNGWWYRNADGTWPASSWFQDPADGSWYMFDARGYIMTGWITDTDGRVYYCDPAGTPAGAMVTGDRVIDGVAYRFDASGAKIAP